MFGFDFLEKDLGLAFAPHSLHDFSRKIFLKLSSDEITLTLLLEILGNMCILIIVFPVENAINLKLTLAFLSTHFPT